MLRYGAAPRARAESLTTTAARDYRRPAADFAHGAGASECHLLPRLFHFIGYDDARLRQAAYYILGRYRVDAAATIRASAL